MSDERDEDGREREEIAFGRRIDWDVEGQLGTVQFGRRKQHDFPPLRIHTIKRLIETGYLPPESTHNESPTAAELLEWAESVLEEYKDYQFDIGLVGYMVGPARDDSRIRLRGVSILSPGPIPDDLKREAIARFDPDLLSVDDFDIELSWD